MISSTKKWVPGDISPCTHFLRLELAEPTGLEPATSDVTGRRSNQLNYDSAIKPEFSNWTNLTLSYHNLSTFERRRALQMVGAEGLEPPTSSL